MPGDTLRRFQPATRAWFASTFVRPTRAQDGAWEAIAGGKNVLVVAPTGSGKTLAAFLWSLDRLGQEKLKERPEKGFRVVYVSPLKALAADVERNLRSPLVGIRAAADRIGVAVADVAVDVRTGDTSAAERRRMSRTPADILITTPESLYLLLTSAARDTLRSVDMVIVDEVHAVVGTKRGSHLALSLERLDCLLLRPARRIGLSATVDPLDEVARFLGGAQPVEVVDAREEKVVDVSVVVPVEDMTAMGDLEEPASGDTASDPRRASVWPHVEARVLELIRAHRSTIVFANSRRLAERFCARLNEAAEGEVARAHHGSISHAQRAEIEDALKSGRLPAVVATSSLELGIDMGAVDLVVQIAAPESVASGLQRIGRAGHQVGAVSRGVVFPKYRGDLLQSVVVAERMRAGAIEAQRYPRNPLDVLAQQIVAMVAMDDWSVDELECVIRRAAPFADLTRGLFEEVLDMLAGRYPSDAFAGLRPRINWDRVNGRLEARRGARLTAVTSGGTIPDRGLYGVFLVGEKSTRVGELDEEMVYESRPGEFFILGASSWRIEDITADRVLVSPAPGAPGRMPFWHGDAPGRPVELGRALGAFVREVAELVPEKREQRFSRAGCDARAASNLSRYLDEQRNATGVLPDDRTIVVERFRDVLGDWRVCVHSFFGARVHAPWAQAITARLRERSGLEAQVMYGDDGIVVRIPDGDELPDAEVIFVDPEDLEDLVVAEVGRSALFASRFRECAARALLLPKRRPSGRTPLWLQRQRAASLLQVASQFRSFPIVLETYRECLKDVFDLPAATELLARIRSREVRVVEAATDLPSPFATSLQLAYVSAFMYEGDAPLAERRAQALALDGGLLAELMGREELRELLDAGALADIEVELQGLQPERRARDADDLHDRLRTLGDLTVDEVRARVVDSATAFDMLGTLERQRRALRVRIRGEERWIAAEDAARYRDALGVALPSGLPGSFLDPVADPLGDLVSRFARTHGPFRVRDLAARLGLGAAVATEVLRRLASEGRVLEGEFRPGASGSEWISVDVLRRLRRRSLAVLRREVEPVSPEILARFALAWHDVAQPRPGVSDADRVWRVVEQLQGVPIPASVLERQILPARIPGYSPTLLDELSAAGELVWVGAGALGMNDGWIVLAQADAAPLLLPEPIETALSSLAERIIESLTRCGASFFRQLSEFLDGPPDKELLLALWELVWAGRVTNDTLAPLRGILRARPFRSASVPSEQPRRRAASRTGPPAAAGRWSLTPARSSDTTRRVHAWSGQLLRRHGVVTRGSVVAERLPGGFAAVYPVLDAFEQAGKCRRGYFVEGLGGSQFALPGSVDRMRALASDQIAAATAVTLAVTDPANPYGAALAWPERGACDHGHRAGRKVGASVVLVGGRLVLYVERGGRTILSYTDDEEILRSAVSCLADAARHGTLGKLEPERANGESVRGTPLARMLAEVGFRRTYRGLQFRA